MRTKCLACLSGTEGCTNTHKNRGVKTTQRPVTALRGCLKSVIYLASSRYCWMSTLLFCTWRRWGKDEGIKTANNNKRFSTMLLSLWHLLPLSPSLHSSCSSLTSFVWTPPTAPPLTLPHRISLSTALESSSVNAQTEGHSEKIWRNKVGSMSPLVVTLSDFISLPFKGCSGSSCGLCLQYMIQLKFSNNEKLSTWLTGS